MIISELREENDALKKAIEIMRMKQAKETPTTVTSATVHPAVNKSSSGYDTTPLVVSVEKTEKQSSFAEQTKKNSLPMKLDRKIEGSADSSGDGDEEGQKLWQQTNELQKRIKEALKWVASSKDNIGMCIVYIPYYILPMYWGIDASIHTYLQVGRKSEMEKSICFINWTKP